jgi:hypothetical protein
MKEAFLILSGVLLILALYFAFQYPSLRTSTPDVPNVHAGASACGFAIAAGMFAVAAAIVHHSERSDR